MQHALLIEIAFLSEQTMQVKQRLSLSHSAVECFQLFLPWIFKDSELYEIFVFIFQLSNAKWYSNLNIIHDVLENSVQQNAYIDVNVLQLCSSSSQSFPVSECLPTAIQQHVLYQFFYLYAVNSQSNVWFDLQVSLAYKKSSLMR